ncbi:hypothetical protein pb186bvf_005433 [Paramecium bursaria]
MHYLLNHHKCSNQIYELNPIKYLSQLNHFQNENSTTCSQNFSSLILKQKKYKKQKKKIVSYPIPIKSKQLDQQ